MSISVKYAAQTLPRGLQIFLLCQPVKQQWVLQGVIHLICLKLTSKNNSLPI